MDKPDDLTLIDQHQVSYNLSTNEDLHVLLYSTGCGFPC